MRLHLQQQQQQQQPPAHMIGFANSASVDAKTMTISSAPSRDYRARISAAMRSEVVWGGAVAGCLE
jgi:hypothetical protein